MLAVTPAAAAAVNTLLENPELPEGASLRLQRGVDTAGQPAIGIAIVEEPGPDDEPVPVTDEGGMYLAPDLAGMLDDQVLDAHVEDEQVAFTIRPQSVNGRPPEV